MQNIVNRKPAKILIVEDSEPDQVIIERALADSRIVCDLQVTRNGQEALDHLHSLDNDSGVSAYPDLILMDMNMPVMCGKEALKRIRQEERYKHIPIIMLTTSSYDKDVVDSYKLGVNAYLTKPVSPKDFISAIQEIEHFWLELAVLPTVH